MVHIYYFCLFQNLLISIIFQIDPRVGCELPPEDSSAVPPGPQAGRREEADGTPPAAARHDRGPAEPGQHTLSALPLPGGHRHLQAYPAGQQVLMRASSLSQSLCG